MCVSVSEIRHLLLEGWREDGGASGSHSGMEGKCGGGMGQNNG